MTIAPLKKLFKAAGLPGYLLFFQNILMFLVQRVRDFEQNTALDFSAWAQMAYVGMVFLVCFDILFRQSPHKSKFLFTSPQVFLLGYVMICFVSMLWSPNVMLTGFRAFESLAYLMLISLIVQNLISRLGYQDIVEWGILWIVWHLFWSTLTGIKILGIQYLFWPFGASRLAVPLFFFLALLMAQRKVFKFLIMAFCILSVSNKVYFGIVLGMLGFYYGNSRYRAWMFGGIVSVLFVLVLVDLEELLLSTVFYGREAISMANTSGRDRIWAIAMEGFLQKPLLGYGFVAGENSVLYQNFSSAINTHNFLLSAVLGTGLLGAVLLLLYFRRIYRMASSKAFPASKWRPAMVGTFLMGLVISMTAPGIGGRVYGSWIPLVLIFTLISGLHLKYREHRITTKQRSIEDNLGYA